MFNLDSCMSCHFVGNRQVSRITILHFREVTIMPVSYETIPFEQLLGHQAAYDLIDDAGRDRFEDWDILEFER